MQSEVFSQSFTTHGNTNTRTVFLNVYKTTNQPFGFPSDRDTDADPVAKTPKDIGVHNFLEALEDIAEVAGLETDRCKLVAIEALLRSRVKAVMDADRRDPREAGYQKAMYILKTQFGRPRDTAQSLMNELLVGGPIAPGDVDVLRRLIRKMVICDLALRQMHYTADLNCSTNLRRIVGRRPRHLQPRSVSVASNCYVVIASPRRYGNQVDKVGLERPPRKARINVVATEAITTLIVVDVQFFLCIIAFYPIRYLLELTGLHLPIPFSRNTKLRTSAIPGLDALFAVIHLTWPNCKSQLKHLKHDVHYGAVQKTKYISAIMARYCHTQFDSTLATNPSLLLTVPSRPFNPSPETTNKLMPNSKCNLMLMPDRSCCPPVVNKHQYYLTPCSHPRAHYSPYPTALCRFFNKRSLWQRKQVLAANQTASVLKDLVSPNLVEVYSSVVVLIAVFRIFSDWKLQAPAWEILTYIEDLSDFLSSLCLSMSMSSFVDELKPWSFNASALQNDIGATKQ
ncbi:protein disulfide-isomerase [Clonorchis sinensis]|uniref:Protein disulfide-isomerase n=1 Tax=Clonorchis sinensis TaxID=79923 RepID=G7YAA9_CLOSI|nr:protein disulfide-isomerase [Clonorchis sinensis]